MTTPPPLTDRIALTFRRARAQPEALFLHEQAIQEIEDRLGMVNKTFTDPAVVTDFPRTWAGLLPDAKVVPASDTLGLDVQAHDLVVHGMTLHWANDPVGQLVQCRRALRPDGLFISAAFGGQTLQELRACLGQAEAEVTGGMSPRVAPMGELRDMGGLLQRAGFALPVADAVPLTVSYRDAWALMRELRAMGEANALEARLRKPTSRAVLDLAAQLYQDHFNDGAGRVLATFELIFLTGWAPDDSQQKPLRPGSAQQRLADALNTDETKLRN
ncbi:SAM-dependent methyltransferase [Sulfitobacter alexandrii]|uniref:SAM-dependent methyltransferase n=1 Tax=Sulfitobacter alexandrii TaxID=1917485 RepID=A0A1J0WLJ5_9RHOB|nr:methyltransferase domain-containing protein [Sulfitobacter alexandrii]APE45147.1 SAM-dependent methyltransferase [Sulfitobacter alexandrii]